MITCFCFCFCSTLADLIGMVLVPKKKTVVEAEWDC